MGSSLFNLDDGCPNPTCVGTVFVFKTPIYFDQQLTEEAGFTIGQCTVVSIQDNKEEFYCVWSFKIEYKDKCTGDDFEAEIGLQGFGPSGEVNDFLITAAAGEFEGESGSITSVPIDLDAGLYEYHISL